VVGDWDGNGTTTIGVVDPATMTWYLKNSNGPGGPDIAPFRYGAPGWLPVVGDWAGTGRTGIGVVDPATETWYLHNSPAAGGPDIRPFAYGAPGWRPVVGDWLGNGTTTVGVIDPAREKWYLRDANSGGAPNIAPFSYGGPSWVGLAGHWANPLLATAPATTAQAGLDVPTPQDLSVLADAALTRFAAAGLNAGQLATLRNTALLVANLPGRTLGLEAGNAIYLNADAAGYGWFIDPTPLQDEEFAPDGSALSGSAAAGRMDLLTVVMHEMGHRLGMPDLDTPAGSDALMDATLAPGQRHLTALNAVFASGLD
jgi:hypothetical protein